MTKYLQTPCPNCKQAKLNQPHQSGVKWFAKCDACGKNAGVKVYQTERKKIFEIYRAGRRGSGLVLHPPMYLEAWCNGMSAQEIRQYLRAGKQVLDKLNNF